MYRQPRTVEGSARSIVGAWATVGVTGAILVHQGLEASRHGWWYATVFREDLWLAVIEVAPVLLVRLRRPQGHWPDVWLTGVYSGFAAGAIGGTAALVLSYADVGSDAPRAPLLVDLRYFLFFFGMSYVAGLILGGLAAVARRIVARV